MSTTTIFSTLSKIYPSSDELQFVTKHQYRALKPTWPVALSILFLSLAFLVSDQGRAIIRFTAERSSDGFDEFFLATVLFFVTHGAIMMYAAFMLSAVTRRSQLDKRATDSAVADPDPVDSSINLRWHYSYAAGVFLPIQFLIMSMWFRTDLFSSQFVGVLITGIVAALAFRILANFSYIPVARNLSALTAVRYHPGTRIALLDRLKYWILRLFQVATVPEHRLAQSAIVGFLAMLLAMTFFVDSPEDWLIQFRKGGLVFYVSFVLLHLLYRVAQRRIVRMHQGHTARYIIIDGSVEKWFNRLRWIAIPIILLLLWSADFVNAIGPLAVGLLGTLWLTLLFSGFVESSAKQARLAAIGKATRLTTRSWLFLALLLLMLVELGLTVFEACVRDDYRHRGSALYLLVARQDGRVRLRD